MKRFYLDRWRGWMAVGLAVAVLAVDGMAQVIKLGTVAPEGSPWHEELVTISREWKAASKGRVKLRIYPGGVAGDEPDMLRKIRIGQLHGGAISSNGLITVLPDIEVVNFPMLVQTSEQLERVLAEVGPDLNEAMAGRGFQVLTWTLAGWAQFFTTRPMLSVDDLRSHRLFFWGSDAAYIKLIQDLGFHPVGLSVTDMMPSLQTGLIDAFAVPPVAALSFQWFGMAGHMTTMRFQPMTGVVLVSTKQWNKVPEDLRPELLAIAKEAGLRLRRKSDILEAEAIEAMQKHGLQVHTMPEEAVEEFRDLINTRGGPLFIGPRFSKALYARVKKVVDDTPAAP